MEQDREREILAALMRRNALVCHERQVIDAALFHQALNELPSVLALIDNRPPTRAALTEAAAPAASTPSADSLRTALGLT